MGSDMWIWYPICRYGIRYVDMVFDIYVVFDVYRTYFI